MLNVKDHKTINMFDPFDYLGPKRKKMLEESWAGIFRDHVRHILPVDLLTRYFSTGMGRPTDELVAMTGAMLLQHMHDLTDEETIPSMDSYQLMTRILKEQCITAQGENTDEPRVTLKPNKDIPSDSLQNPSDPDAGYSGHKGKGYQVQIAETYSTEEDAETLSLITYVDVQAAHESDADALIPYLEAAEQRGVKPEEISADTLCGSDDNHEAAKQKGVDLITPAPDPQKDLFCTLTDFEFSENGFVISCPGGCQPVKKSGKKDRFTIAFS